MSADIVGACAPSGAPSGEARAVRPEIMARPVEFGEREGSGVSAGLLKGFDQQVRPGEQAGAKIESIATQFELAQFAADFMGGFEEGDVAPFGGGAHGCGQSTDASPYDRDRAHFPR